MSARTHCLALVLVAQVLIGNAGVGAAGYDRAGTAAAPELLIPVGARGLALGGASIAATSGLEALHWNPAGLSRAQRDFGVLFSTMSYIADIRVNYVAVGCRLPRAGTLALSLKSLDVGAVDITTESQPDGTGGSFSPTFAVMGATHARALSARVSVGATAHYIFNRLGRTSAAGWAFSAGLQYADLGGIGGLCLGVALKHIGSRMRHRGPGLLRRGQLEGVRRAPGLYLVQASSADLPSTFEIGVGYSLPREAGSELNVSSTFQHHSYDHDQYRVGAEYLHGGFLALRWGLDHAANAPEDASLFGTSFGFGITLEMGGVRRAHLDYAYTAAQNFGGLNTFTCRLGL